MSRNNICLTRRLALLLAVGITGAIKAQIPPVPPEYQQTNQELMAAINVFDNTILSSWNGTLAPVKFCAQLSGANSNLGPSLFKEGHLEGILYELDGYKALGVKGITLTVNFPILYRPFHQDTPGEYEQYLNFYIRVADEVRARGMELMVESQVGLTMAGIEWLEILPYLRSLNFVEYKRGRAEVARTIAEQLRPNYLSVIGEPDTEAAQTRKPVLATVAGSTDLLYIVTSAVRISGVPVSIGAGVGTWVSAYAEYIQSFAAVGVDYIDMHVYPLNFDSLDRAIRIADLAKSLGKKIAISEAWAYKMGRGEEQLPRTQVFTRDAFSFWQPLDSRFLQTMVHFAHYKQLAFMAPFFSGNYRDYIDYSDSTKNLTYPEMITLLSSAQAEAIHNGLFTNTGLAFKELILNQTDGSPPGIPISLSGTATSETSTNLTWSPSTDNVGVAGYVVYRNGLKIATTAHSYFDDGGLTRGTLYNYRVSAYDASGNTSSPASTSVMTLSKP